MRWKFSERNAKFSNFQVFHPVGSEKTRKDSRSPGDLTIGTLAGYPGVDVRLNSNQKKVIPRNIGIFGTVGSGKTNTAQVLIEEVARAGYAVIVFDVEGEYVEMDQPSTEKTSTSV